MRFELATATRIVFGPGTLAEAGEIVRALGRRALVVTGSRPERAEPLLAMLAERGVSTISQTVSGEPTVAAIREGVRRAAGEACDAVVAIGGGSALDAGKATAALLANGGDLLDYLEIVGRGQPLTRPSLPFVAIPTTAGTGSEVTRNAVLASPEHGVKASLRSPLMLPRVALVDPEPTHDLPRDVTARTGLDALTQLIEPFVSRRANPLVDAFCREGLWRGARSLRRACEHGEDAAAREDMALASLLGGLALANAGLGIVHGLAAVLGGRFAAPHGALCARLLAPGMRANLRALEERAPGSEALARYGEVARIVTGRADAGAEDGVAWAHALARDLEIPSLAAYGVGAADLEPIAAQAERVGSTQGNPIVLARNEIVGVLAEAM